MSLRKFIHPRNKYRKAPNFKQLALLYPEFRNVVITNLAGKVRIDFKNEKSLRVLTEVLLKHDFDLTVKIPPNKLVPTLPLRLNYILWIEDLMKYASLTEMEQVKGIDIGTGAVCIYPLLFVRMFGSRMIATDVDESSIKTAAEQIENNNLQHLISIIKVSEGTILKGILQEDQTYQFSMCNPPFFEMEHSEEKTTKRLPPRNAPTGNEGELTIQGGERAFVTQMIDESIELKDKVKIYTTMFGRKGNLLFLLKFLKRKNIKNSTWTEFCQGYTKRWGLAWSFLPKEICDLKNAPVIRKSGDYISKLLRDHRPTEIMFPIEDKFPSFEQALDFLRDLIKDLQIQITDLNLPVHDFEGWACRLTAEKDTWSHARRKRRMEQRQNQATENRSTKATNDETQNNKNMEVLGTQGEPKISTESSGNEPLLVCNFFVQLVEYEDEAKKEDFKIYMLFENGSGGKNSLETFRQYLVNKLNVQKYVKRQCEGQSEKKRKRKRLKKSSSRIESS